MPGATCSRQGRAVWDLRGALCWGVLLGALFAVVSSMSLFLAAAATMTASVDFIAGTLILLHPFSSI